MRTRDFAQAALLPLSNVAVLFSLLFFWGLICLASAAGMLGIWLSIVIVPALFRYLTNLVETVGRNRRPEPPGSEFFRWMDEIWSLFPALIVVAVAWGSYAIQIAAGSTTTIVFIIVVGLIYPAMLGVLSVTHSPLQTMNPTALFHFVRRIGPAYLVAPAYLAVIVFVSTLVQPLPFLIELFIELLLVFSLHSVIGFIIAPHELFDDLRIPDPVERDRKDVDADIEKGRTDALTHAYGFISRGNRDGGFKYISERIANDPEEVAAWAWYFERMLRWENKAPALYFAQKYIHDMLQHSEEIPALKVIMRCQLLDPEFQPLAEDRPAAIAAAERCGNNELAAVLKRH